MRGVWLAGLVLVLVAADGPFRPDRKRGLDLPIDPKEPRTEENQVGSRGPPASGLDSSPSLSPEPARPPTSEVRTRSRGRELLVPPVTEPPPPTTPETHFWGISARADRLLYVVDRSGSMLHRGKLEEAKRQLRMSIDGMEDRVNFDMVQYGRDRSSHLGKLEPATEGHKSQARAWVDSLYAHGDTATAPAMWYAFKTYDPEAIFLLTDGRPNIPRELRKPEDHLRLILEVWDGPRVNCLGIEATGLFEEFLKDLASATGGSYAQVK